MTKYFVLLGTQSSGKITPVTTAGDVVLFKTHSDATKYALTTFAGRNWGFKIYEAEIE